ncbi:hypothetical protein [Streptomyces laurentii]
MDGARPGDRVMPADESGIGVEAADPTWQPDEAGGPGGAEAEDAEA